MTGPQDPAAAGRGRLRAGHADREQAIDTLKTAFVHGQLTKDELDARAGHALAARTYADLAALTADIPPRPPAARPARPPAPARRPLARAAAKSGACLIIAAAATWVLALLVSADGHYHGIPGANPSYESWAPLALVLAFAAVCAAIGIMGSAVVTSLEQRRSRRWLPPGPGGHTQEAERRGGTGHGPVPPGPPHRPGPGRPAGSQVTAAPTACSHPRGPGIPWRQAGARHDLTPVNQRRDRRLPGCPGRALRAGPHQIAARPGAKQATRERAEPRAPRA